mgnify:CR=1
MASMKGNAAPLLALCCRPLKPTVVARSPAPKDRRNDDAVFGGCRHLLPCEIMIEL